MSSIHPPVLMIGTPIYEGKVSLPYALSILRFQEACFQKEDLEFTGVAQWGDSLLTRAKQGILTQFLGHPTATHLLFVDGNIAFQPSEVVRLLELNVELAAGSPFGPNGEFRKVSVASSRFMLIKRSAIDSMTQRYPELRYRNEFAKNGTAPALFWNYALFNCMIDPQIGTFLDGDQSFCQRWTQIGGEIWSNDSGPNA